MYLYRVVLDGGRRIVVWSSSVEPAYYQPEVIFGMNGVQHLVQRVMEPEAGDGVDRVIHAALMKPRGAAA